MDFADPVGAGYNARLARGPAGRPGYASGTADPLLVSAMFLALFWFLLAGAGSARWLADRRGWRPEWPAGAIGLTALTVTWLVTWPLLPLDFTLTRWPSQANLQPWQWRVDSGSWSVSLGWLVLAAIVAWAMWTRPSDSHPAGEPGLLLLTATGLLALWTAPGPGQVAAWFLLGLVVAGVMAPDPADPGNQPPERGGDEGIAGRQENSWPNSLWSGRLLWLWAGPALLWLALALVHGPDPAAAWPWFWLAAVAQLGLIPFHGWRRLAARQPSPLVALAGTLPALAGAVWLADGSLQGEAAGAAWLALALLSLLVGAFLSWWRPGGFALGLAGLLLLGTAAGPGTVRGLALVLLLGPLLVLPGPAPVEGRSGSDQTRLATLLTVTMALMVAGAPLYAHWLNDGPGWLLLAGWPAQAVLVAGLGVYLLPLGLLDRSRQPDPGPGATFSRPAPGRGPAWVGPLLALAPLAFLPYALAWRAGATGLVTSLLAVGSGLAWAVYARTGRGPGLERLSAGRWARDRMTRRLTGLAQLVAGALAAGRTALREAGLVLEGEGGMIWLLFLVVLFGLARLG